jgi:DNA-binding transcriptional LysR family regulator
MIDVGALRALRSVAALGTLARAAEELGFTASAVSQQIKRLEHQLGVPVLAQAGRGVVLTPAGRAIAAEAQEVFLALERCAEAAKSVAGTPSGTLRIAAFSTAIRGLLSPTIPRLASNYPDLELHVTEQDPDQAVHSVNAGMADLAIIHDADGLPPAIPASITQRHLHTDIGDVVMKRTHPLAQHDRPLTSADLTAQQWVTSPPGTVCHQWFANTAKTPDVRHSVDDFATQLALVAASNVIALIPRLARPPLGDDLVARPLKRRPRREIHAAWRTSANASPAIQAVLAELR